MVFLLSPPPTTVGRKKGVLDTFEKRENVERLFRKVEHLTKEKLKTWRKHKNQPYGAGLKEKFSLLDSYLKNKIC